ncbi:hypothetical protein MGH68_07760 [Erysipelothrix sp. D19-032]
MFRKLNLHMPTTQRSQLKEIQRIKDGEMISFLDIDIDETPLLSKIVNSNILLFEEIEGVKIYGISYRMLVDFITM